MKISPASEIVYPTLDMYTARINALTEWDANAGAVFTRAEVAQLYERGIVSDRYADALLDLRYIEKHGTMKIDHGNRQDWCDIDQQEICRLKELCRDLGVVP